MPVHIDPNDPACAEAASEILRRHDAGELEANITTAVRDFLVRTRLVNSNEIDEENAPALGSRSAVDLTALDTFVEVKRRIGTAAGFQPDPENVEQLDDYLEQSQKQGRVRMGILTDGKYWLLRWPGAGPVTTAPPYAFTLEHPDRWIALYEWLREPRPLRRGGQATLPGYHRQGLRPQQPLLPARHSRPQAPLRPVRRRRHHKSQEAAMAGPPHGGPGRGRRQPRPDGRPLRPTHLPDRRHRHGSAGPLRHRHTPARGETDPADILHGRDFRSKTGLQGIVESDFFAWPTEVGGLPMLATLARRVARFDWKAAPNDIAAILYETVIPPDERRQLGEYYTPDWLARTIVRETVTDPLHQRVLDPACGSGTFVAEAVAHFIAAAQDAGMGANDVFSKLRESVTGIDVHPVAVHLARSAWVLAAQPAIQAAVEQGLAASVTVPIYLGDALQLRFRPGDMFARHDVTLQVQDDENTELVFPVSLVRRAETFDALMGDVAEAIETGDDPALALDDNHITDPGERQTLEKTVAAMQRLHSDGRNHIWAYYTRNLVRPVTLSQGQGRRHRRQPALAHLPQTRPTLCARSWSGKARMSTAFGSGADTPTTRTYPVSSSPEASTSTFGTAASSGW